MVILFDSLLMKMGIFHTKITPHPSSKHPKCDRLEV
jgi:hypothetical protein